MPDSYAPRPLDRRRVALLLLLPGRKAIRGGRHDVRRGPPRVTVTCLVLRGGILTFHMISRAATFDEVHRAWQLRFVVKR